MDFIPLLLNQHVIECILWHRAKCIHAATTTKTYNLDYIIIIYFFINYSLTIPISWSSITTFGTLFSNFEAIFRTLKRFLDPRIFRPIFAIVCILLLSLFLLLMHSHQKYPQVPMKFRRKH